MRDMRPLLDKIHFPAITRGTLETLQVNVGYRCNQSCFHCHVNAGPNRAEEMTADVADVVLEFLKRRRIGTLDITGGAPELNANFRRLVTDARKLAVKVMDRCNLTILEQPGQEDLAEFLSSHQVEVVASMPCYLQDNVERQRGKGAFDASIRGLKKLNAVGYGRDCALALNLVYNPQGPSLPPAQASLEADYKRMLGEQYGIVFNKLFVLANMPIQRFGSTLVTNGEFKSYLGLLQDAHLDTNLDGVMCRNLISVDWRGYVYDCDFNQMLDLPLARGSKQHAQLSDLLDDDLAGDPRRRPLLWLHGRPRLKLRRRAERSRGMKLSIVIPTLDEAIEIEAALQALAPLRHRGVEVIVADGGSRDGTADLARPLADCVITAPRGRASQMNTAVTAAQGDVFLFLHADTRLPEDADTIVLESLARSGRAWGRFDVRIDGDGLLRLVSLTMNWRSRLTGIATGDQAIFVTRAAFEATGGFPSIALMEDVALSAQLKRIGRPLALRARVITSPRRWRKHGTLRTVLLMWQLRLRFFLGADPAQLARAYGYAEN